MKKQTIIKPFGQGKKYWMSEKEYTSIVVGKEATNGEYVISDGVIQIGGFIPNHYHKWEDQTFHIIKGTLEAKIGDKVQILHSGDTVHCPKEVSHYMKNIGKTEAKIISYIFPGHKAEAFMAETSRQVQNKIQDFDFIEREFGVVYIND